MDNDGKTDIITLDDSGEINIFYGGGNSKNPTFTKKLIGSGTGLQLSSEPRSNGALINYNGLYQIPEEPNTSTGIVNEDFLNRQIFVKQIVGASSETGLNTTKTFIKSEYSNSAGIEVKKIYKDLNGETLKSGDIIEVEISIKNISNSIKRNISYLDKIQKPFVKSNEEINYEELGFSEPLPGYDFYIKDFNLTPGAEKIIKYKLKTPSLSYGNIKVGLFENGELGDDSYGDIIIKKDDKNCSQNSQIYKSIYKRTYSELKKMN
ncbi:MAG: hypothetical protein Q9M97_09195 [Candidatus Gracilibacteria bacterium]|nr:hypothetical protein [Candidatus Gracilibacteria bacterium]